MSARASTPPPSRGDARPRALVVDDSRTYRYVVAAVLRELGFEVLEAADAFSGLAQVRRAGPFALLVLDLHLPGMSGPELVRVLRADGSLGAARVLLATADEDPGAARAGAHGALAKPFSRDELAASLRSLGLLP